MATGFENFEFLLGYTGWSGYETTFVLFRTSLKNGEKVSFSRVAKRTRTYSNFIGDIITEKEYISIADYKLIRIMETKGNEEEAKFWEDGIAKRIN